VKLSCDSEIVLHDSQLRYLKWEHDDRKHFSRGTIVDSSNGSPKGFFPVVKLHCTNSKLRKKIIGKSYGKISYCKIQEGNQGILATLSDAHVITNAYYSLFCFRIVASAIKAINMIFMHM